MDKSESENLPGPAPDDRHRILLGELEPPPEPPIGAVVTDDTGHQWEHVGTDQWIDLTCAKDVKSPGFTWTWALVFADCTGGCTVTVEDR